MTADASRPDRADIFPLGLKKMCAAMFMMWPSEGDSH